MLSVDFGWVNISLLNLLASGQKLLKNVRRTSEGLHPAVYIATKKWFNRAHCRSRSERSFFTIQYVY